jgi:uncharacterized membrane protein YfcA
LGAAAVPGLAAAIAAVHLGAGQLALLAAAGLAAGAVNAVAGGGSLISFPALLAAGYGSVTANVTNAVAVLPGYLGGTIGYRAELEGQRPRAIALSITSAVGAVAGAWLLIVSPAHVFRSVVPFLILGSCALLAAQPAISRRLPPPREGPGEHLSLRLHAMQLAASVYGGYFGAGLGILLLAVLGIGLRDSLQRLNALKGLLSLVVGVAAVAYFAAFGPVAWGAAAVMAAASLIGGRAGAGLARKLTPFALRWVVIAFGVGVAIALLIGD